jgi:SAM-dependent methyltransferase
VDEVMTMEVLQAESQIANARQELIRRGVSLTDSRLRSMMRRFGFVRGVAVGDTVKSWDVLSTLNFIGQYVKQRDPILDIGCYASEVIVALHRLGYSNLTGVDLNLNLTKMPYQDSIRYEIGDFTRTKFEDASFQAITSISVIEHGFNGQSLLKEMSRLLKPGGYFVASFDYWPEKIDTDGIKFFGMDWQIFSRDDVADLVSQAAGYGLSPVGTMTYEGRERPIDCGGRQYTFAWMVLRKIA